jgi:hypothetical protein
MRANEAGIKMIPKSITDIQPMNLIIFSGLLPDERWIPLDLALWHLGVALDVFDSSSPSNYYRIFWSANETHDQLFNLLVHLGHTSSYAINTTGFRKR